MPISTGAISSPSTAARHALDLDLTTIEFDDDAPFAKLPVPFSPRDQDGVECCVSCAIVTAMEALDARLPDGELGGGLDPVEVQRGRATELSPLFLHFATTRGQNRAVSPLAALESVARYGVCPARMHVRAINPQTVRVPPGQPVVRAAHAYRLKATRRGVQTRYYNQIRGPVTQQWKRLLLAECPVLAVIEVNAAYERMGLRKPDGLPVTIVHRKPVEWRGYYHCVTVLGFSNRLKAFYVVDSRGSSWGHGGAWWLPYRYASTSLVVESWTISDLTYG
ncbi:MAG: hypothetical protein AAGI53_06575 [Planctomycetota bacterium]